MKEQVDSANVREALANLGMEKREGWQLPRNPIPDKKNLQDFRGGITISLRRVLKLGPPE
jgi:hypothetical protein